MSLGTVVGGRFVAFLPSVEAKTGAYQRNAIGAQPRVRSPVGSNDNTRSTHEEVAAATLQLAADSEHLWALHLRLLRTEAVIARGLAACAESRELLRRFESYKAP
jgi:hypothetical protein